MDSTTRSDGGGDVSYQLGLPTRAGRGTFRAGGEMSQSETAIAAEARGPVRFPPGALLLPALPFATEILADVDRLVASGRCPEGRFEIETAESRLTCLIHRGRTLLAGLQEREVFSRVPLVEFASRAGQLREANCRLLASESAAVLMAAVHFCRRPVLQSTTDLVDPAHVLRLLEQARQDAAIAFERQGARTLFFLHRGRPARLYFGDPADDPGSGDLESRILGFAFSPGAPIFRVEVFTDLKIDPDPDAGATLEELAAAAAAPPPSDVTVTRPDGRELRRRPFVPPHMIIGRDPTADLFIDNLAVSRKHARLSWQRGGFVLEDLGSANGTEVNGESISRAELAAEDRIRIGKFEIAIERYEAMPRVQETIFMPPANAPAPGYLVGEGVSLRLDRDRIIGRGAGVDARARGFRVRPVHARVSFEDGETFRLTCFGRAKARVNGRRVGAAELEIGDTIGIGRSRFRLTSRP